jgi:uncharacterized protein YjbI with pentapeptide repeats
MPQRPATDDREAWTQYWKAIQPQEWFESWGFWRTEPEISPERQSYLLECLSTSPNIKKGIFPFKDIHLERADIEWLLANLSSNGYVGPINWDDPRQQNREGIDLRGTDLRKLDLSHLPLANMRGGLAQSEWKGTTEKERDMAAARLDGEEINLNGAHLEGAHLGKCHLDRAQLKGAHLQGAYLRRAWMIQTYLLQADMRGVILKGAHLEGTFFSETLLGGISPSEKYPGGLPPVDLREAFFDHATFFENASLGDTKTGAVRVVDARWSDINLSLIDWAPIKRLGDEQIARSLHSKDRKERAAQFREAVRANRQLSSVLRSQGLNEEADYFAYRAQMCQRAVFRYQAKSGRYTWSAFLDFLAGYGYQPIRTLLIYLLAIIGFSAAYIAFGSIDQHTFTLHEAIIFSLTSFHGRGFFPGGLALDDPITTIAAIEAILGLLIEISFIATFTQRYFGR